MTEEDPHSKYPNKFWESPNRRSGAYQKSLESQTNLWMQGTWWHNTFSDECTADFGCCAAACREMDASKRREQGMRFLMDIAR